MADEGATRCPVCRGRGYLRCDCWPGNCICGWDDEGCENCRGEGWVYPDEYDDDYFPDPPAKEEPQ